VRWPDREKRSQSQISQVIAVASMAIIRGPTHSEKAHRPDLDFEKAHPNPKCSEKAHVAERVLKKLSGQKVFRKTSRERSLF
jgi:hypothetical protein